VNSSLNGTVMDCIDVGSSNASSTTIIIREREPLQGTYAYFYILITNSMYT
jgi:hypothetical protein